MKGILPLNESWSASSPVDSLKDHVLQEIVDVFETRLQKRGFSLNETAAFTGILEALAFQDALRRVRLALMTQDDVWPDNNFSVSQAKYALDLFIRSLIF